MKEMQGSLVSCLHDKDNGGDCGWGYCGRRRGRAEGRERTGMEDWSVWGEIVIYYLIKKKMYGHYES